jgi:hypothetical protein
MNIRQHIDAGHYPKDEKGRALVTMQSGGVAVIYATDHPTAWCITGREQSQGILGHTWNEDGSHEGEADSPSTLDLLPPLRRKEIIKAWAVRGETHVIDHFHDEARARAYAATFKSKHGVATVIELTGEYEQEWS